MPTPVRQTRTAFPSVAAPLRAVVQGRVEPSVPDDRGQALPGEGNVRAGVRSAAPDLDVDAAVAVADQGGEAVLERLVGEAVDRRAVVPVDIGEAAVEGREQPPALAEGNRHRPAHGRVGGLVAAGIEAERGPRVVEPGDVGDDARIVALGAEGRDEHRRAPVDQRARLLPHSLARQRVREDRLDPRRPRRDTGVRSGRLADVGRDGRARLAGRPRAGSSVAGRPSSAPSSRSRCSRPRRPASCRGGFAATRRCAPRVAGSTAEASWTCTSRRPARAARPRSAAARAVSVGAYGGPLPPASALSVRRDVRPPRSPSPPRTRAERSLPRLRTTLAARPHDHGPDADRLG